MKGAAKGAISVSVKSAQLFSRFQGAVGKAKVYTYGTNVPDVKPERNCQGEKNILVNN